MTTLSRRHLITSGAVAAAAGLSLPKIVLAQAPATPAPAAPPPAAPAFSLPPLAYPPAALEPHIDARTMEIHHGRHHAAYVANLNNLAKDNPQIAQRPIPDLLAKLSDVPEAIRIGIRNNAGGHANHTMFWQIMGPGGGGQPDGEVFGAIQRDFGGFDTMQGRFNDGGLRVFGSGWVFMIVDKEGKLAIETRPNQDSPLMDGKRVLFGNDVWEHAYYLNYQNRRADYLKSWWNTVNWAKIGERYAAAKAGTLAV